MNVKLRPNAEILPDSKPGVGVSILFRHGSLPRASDALEASTHTAAQFVQAGYKIHWLPATWGFIYWTPAGLRMDGKITPAPSAGEPPADQKGGSCQTATAPPTVPR